MVDRLSCGIKLKPGPKTPPPAPSGGCTPLGAISSFFSFEGETVVDAIEGQKKIRDIAVGDLVASRDAFTGAKTFRPVTDLFRRTAPGIVHVTLDGPDGKRETLDVTSEHPLFAEGKGWTQVRRLQKGDRILSGKGGLLAVADIAHDNTPTLVYNFEVAQDHSYFAGSEGAWSHNARSGTSGNNSAAQSGKLKHKAYNPPGTTNTNYDTGNGFADAVDLINYVVCELKPNNPRAIARGWKQLERYAEALEKRFNRSFRRVLDTY